MTKKILAALVCAAIVLSATACSGSSTSPEGNFNNTQISTKQESAIGTKQESEPEETRVTNKEITVGKYDGKYTGDWGNNAPNGNGIFTAEGQVTVSGAWVNGMLNGQGTMEWTNGAVSSGNFVNNKLNGKGSKKYTSKDDVAVTMDGTFNDGSLSSGKKTYTYTDGSVHMYDGEWDSDGYFSSGTKTVNNADGSSTVIKNGVWNGGKLVSGKKTFKDTNGLISVYEGEWNDEGKFYNGTYENYGSSGSLDDSGTVTNGKWVSDFNKAVGGLFQNIGDSIIDEHPFIGGALELIGGYIGG